MRQIDNRTWEVDRPVWPGFLNHRKPESGKWDYGHALLVAGSYGKMGAAGWRPVPVCGWGRGW